MSLSMPIKITILGQQYQIACLPEEQLALVESARLLDERLKVVREEKRLPLDQAAIMTALNLAHDFLEVSAKYEALQKQTNQSLNELNQKLDGLL